MRDAALLWPLALLSFGSMAAAQADPPQRIVKPAVGCQTLDDFDALAHIADTGDRVAFDKFTRTKRASGACRAFDPEQRAFLVKVGNLGRVGCLRPVGEIECFWVRSILFRPES